MFKNIKNFLNKLTLLGKIAVIIPILFICFLLLNIYAVTVNRNLLNTSTGEIISRPGMYFRPLWSHTIFRNDCKYIYLKAYVQDKSNNAYLIQIKAAYKFNLDWIQRNKSIPEEIEINKDNLSSYLIDNYINYSFEELNKNNRKLQYEIINSYFKALNKDDRYIIEEILIYRPLIQVQNIPLD